MKLASSALYIPIGFLYLWIRYRKKERMRKILEEEYEGSYYYAGAELSLKIFGTFLFVLLSVFLLATLVRVATDIIKWF